MANNNKEQIILNALLAYPTVREASEATGIPESTIYLRLRNAEFKQKYKQAKDEMLHSTTTYLQSKLHEATGTIVDIMNDTETASQVRINAARAVFDYCIRLTEQTDIIRRLEALEEAQNDGGWLPLEQDKGGG